MSQTGYVRLVAVLQSNSGAREELSAFSGSAHEVVTWAGAKGYELTVDEAEHILASLQELSDEELDKVAGGEDAWSSGGGTPPPPTDP